LLSGVQDIGRRRIQRCEAWWYPLWRADLGLPIDSASALRRPVLIISADQDNRSDLRTVTVVVMTTNNQRAALPGNVTVAADLAGLEVESVVNVTTIDRVAPRGSLGALPDWLMALVDTGLTRALALVYP